MTAKYTVEVWTAGFLTGEYLPIWSGDILPEAYAQMADAKERYDTVALVWREKRTGQNSQG